MIERLHNVPAGGSIPAAHTNQVSFATSAPRMQRAGLRAALFSICVAGLAGCGHKTIFVVPSIYSLAPVDLEVPPEPKTQPELATEQTVDLPPIPRPEPRLVVRRRPTTTKDSSSTQVAGAEPSAIELGELSLGGDTTTPQTQQQIKEGIASIQKRVAALPAKLAAQQRSEVSQVSRFLRQALQALATGDAEGAKNLATKARLLMDDIEKK